MPVTAKLSRRFYDTFGDEIANELVEWFNQVDATYRADLRELNELNFQRFDAKLEQRLAQQDVRWETQLAALRAELQTAIAEQGAEFRAAIADQGTELREAIAELRAELRTEMAALEARLRTAMADQRAELHRSLSRYWAGTVIPLAGLIIALFIRG